MAPDTPDQRQTILLVEDEEEFRTFLFGLLTDIGCNVLRADDEDQAIQHSHQFKGPINLLLSDVKLGNSSGIELATRLQSQRPEMKVMLVSGFTFGTLVLDHGWQFFPRPFVPDMLKQIVEKILLEPRQSFPGSGGIS